MLPFAETGKDAAAELAEELATKPTMEDVSVVEPDKVMTTVAITPSDIATELSPQTRQVILPVD